MCIKNKIDSSYNLEKLKIESVIVFCPFQSTDWTLLNLIPKLKTT